MTTRSGLEAIRDFFAAPVLEDEEKRRAARLASTMLNLILISALLTAIAISIASPLHFTSNMVSVGLYGGLVTVSLALRFALRRGYVRAVGAIMTAAIFVLITISLWNFGGITNVTAAGYLLSIIIAGLLVGGRASITTLVFSLVALVGIWQAEKMGLIVSGPEDRDFTLIANGALFGTCGLLVWYAASNLGRALDRARRNEQAQIQANRELQALRDSLEQQVADRTHDLERRSAYLAASVETGRIIASILEIESLLQEVVELIRQRFDLYYVGLFLRDASGRWADFGAGTGEVGQVLRKQRLRIEVGGDSILGWCMENAQTRVANDVRAETNRVDHPLLAATRSEIALPLTTRGRVIGALSAQSDRPNAFDPDMVAALQTMADHVAVALDNARLFSEAQAALEAERRAYGEVGRQAWLEAIRALSRLGYTCINQQVTPITQVEAAATDSSGATLSLPITVRGVAIGTVDLHKDAASQWQEEEIALLRTLVDQLGVALESARLYEDTQRRAAREKLAGEIAAQIRQSLDIKQVLQAAARELGQALQATRVNVRLIVNDE